MSLLKPQLRLLGFVGGDDGNDDANQFRRCMK